MSRDGMICPGTERYVLGRKEGRNDMLGDGTRDGTICSATERGTERKGTKRNEGRNGTIISKNVKMPMRTLYIKIGNVWEKTLIYQKKYK
jgi:hypothetical protein